ncbi:hypothetical protein [Streptomyces roseochromogenus]|uniref:Uncharacterized protein n=1 Tax=Streptomyces roseochromogenus subsp. oscitans DS 12.976 TaxID=1352936 RepID=V6L4V9_STRRC|nr:hypothetical protein [Streptomyces roseochromogenus]EST36254.1 hypothetical protein M878_02790 [Streptomyces roseochromogenus subsp. oscitans DS 12.976]
MPLGPSPRSHRRPPFFRRRLREAFAAATDGFAQEWNETVPKTMAQDMSRLRERVQDAAAAPPEETRP